MNYSNHAPMHYANEALSEAGVVALRSGHPIGGSVKRAFDIFGALVLISSFSAAVSRLLPFGAGPFAWADAVPAAPYRFQGP